MDTSALLSVAKPTASAVETMTNETTDARVDRGPPSVEGPSISARQPSASRLPEEEDEQHRPEQIRDVLDRVARRQVAGVEDVAYVNERGANGEHCRCDHRRLSKSVPSFGSDRAEDPDGQIGEPDLELERTARIPTDRVGDLLGDEHVSDESADSTPGHPDDEQRNQHCFCFADLAARQESNNVTPAPRATGRTVNRNVRVTKTSTGRSRLAKDCKLRFWFRAARPRVPHRPYRCRRIQPGNLRRRSPSCQRPGRGSPPPLGIRRR